MIVGIDTGGTFTDGVVYDSQTGEVRIAKVLSTADDPSSAFVEAVLALDAPLENVRGVVHGTTIATNAVLQRRGAVCGLITTRGFRDVLELRRRDRPSLYGLRGTYEPLIRRHLRIEVAERTTADGSILQPVDEAEVEAAALQLRELGVEVLVISFLHAYANPENEQRAVKVAARVWPNGNIVVAHEVMPQFREFERLSTAVVNGYVQPLLTGYLDQTYSRLVERDYVGDFTVIQSNGGAMSHRLAGRFGVNLVMSGPAAGVTAACAIARAGGVSNIVTFDMGGTSTDICLVKDGVPATTSTKSLGFGIPLGVSMLDIETLGAGGGSIAFIDRSGILDVGPVSAGSVPGPACYGRGGIQPTVTDANVILGRISSDGDLGGRGQLQLDVEAARRAIEAQVAKPLGMDLVAAAQAIVAIANNKMAASMRLVSVDRGQDPRDFSLVAFGGAGPLHASSLMHEAGFERTLVPLFPGITSAFGCVLSDLRADSVVSLHQLLEDIKPEALKEICATQYSDALDVLTHQGVDEEDVETEITAEMCYLWQTTTISVPLASSALDFEDLNRRFAVTYTQLYGSVLDMAPVELVAIRTILRSVRKTFDLERLAATVLRNRCLPRGERTVVFDSAEVSTPVYDRLDLSTGFRSTGPAVLQQQDSTVLIAPTDDFSVDAQGTVVIETAR